MTIGSRVRRRRLGRLQASRQRDDVQSVQSLLAEAFPAPKPDCVKTRKLRYISGRGSLGLILPPEVLAVAGLVEGDRLEISAWSGGGTIKLRKVESEQ